MTALPLWRAVWLLARLRLLRLMHAYGAGGRAGPASASRPASRGKRRRHRLLAPLLGLILLVGSVELARNSLRNLSCHLDLAAHCSGAVPLPVAPFSAGLTAGMTMLLLLLLLVGALLQLGGRELAQPDWDLEWLVTLPLARNTLLISRLAERSVANPIATLLLWPFCLALAWCAGFRWSAPLLATVAALPLLLLVSVLWTLVDTGLRLSLAPSRLRNLQALLAALGTPLLMLALSFGTQARVTFMFELAAAFPAWTLWTPPGLVVQALAAPHAVAGIGLAGLLYLQVVLAGGIALLLLRHQLRHGVVTSGSRESGRSASRTVRRWSVPGTPVQRRELLLLARDRNFLVQSLLLPVVVVASQLLLQGRLDGLTQLGREPAVMASFAFFLGAHVLMLSAFQTLNREGGALWLLYTLPRPISVVLREKAQLWAALAALYPLAVFELGLAGVGGAGWHVLWLLFLALAGMPIFAFIAVALGVFAFDPLAPNPAKPRLTYGYLYLLLSAMYVYSMVAGPWWRGAVFVVLALALALALWQKATDALPFLLEPDMTPPARVSSGDGIIAAMLFFVLQSVAVVLLHIRSVHGDGRALLLAFCAAGGATYLSLRLYYWRRRASGVPRLLGQVSATAALRTGLLVGAPLALCAFGYLWLLRRFGSGPADLADATVSLHASPWFFVLAVLAAPLFEEFIFRGLIFGGLRRSMPLWLAALVSAALFALVHPPLAMAPVLLLGLATALVYERSKSLLAPMAVHATYNALLLASQWL